MPQHRGDTVYSKQERRDFEPRECREIRAMKEIVRLSRLVSGVSVFWRKNALYSNVLITT